MQLKIKQRLLRCLTRVRGGEHLAELNREMHRHGKFRGISWRSSLSEFREAVPALEQRTILDYGCGPLGGLRGAFPERTIAHDPYVDEFAEPPWGKPFDTVFSSDVLEHMTLSEVRTLADRIKGSTAEYVFLVVSTRAAGKHLANGANAHLLIKSPEWWRKTLQRALGEAFQLTVFKADLLRRDVTLCFHRPPPAGTRSA